MLHEIIERFAGRYEIWRDEQRAEREAADGNPYRRWLWIICAFLAWDIYKFAALHQFDWRSVQFSLLSIVFLLTYFLSPRRVWLMFLIVGVIAIVESPSVYAINPLRYPPRVRLISALAYSALGVGAFFYGFVIRRRYEAYYAQRQASS